MGSNYPLAGLFVLDECPEPGTVYSSPQGRQNWGRLSHVSKPYVPPECPGWPDKHGDTRPDPDVWDLYTVSKHRTDIMWYPGICVVSDLVAEVLAEENFSGIDLREVRLFEDAWGKRPIRGYKELRFTGAVPLDLKRCGIRLVSRCKHCGATMYTPWDKWKRLEFEGSFQEWPDAFMMSPKETLYFFVKARLANVLMDNKWDVVNLLPAELLRN